MPYDRILELMSPADWPGLYFLGTYAKRLTVYSQQTRAINLVDAIHWYRRPLKGASLAVVGGGAAGITAAARASQLGARVTLIERLQNVLEIQNKSDRWLHPTLYEWPFSGIDPREDTTQLPVMNWTAATAKEVADTLTKEWNEKYAGVVTTHFNSDVFEIEPGPAASRLKWRYKTTSGHNEDEDHFEHVILAVGYGLEPRGRRRTSYWQNDSLDKTLRTDECVLVAGYGDGALTDLMRACLNKFDHRQVLTQIASAVNADDRVLSRIKAIETDVRASDAEYLTGEYLALSVPGVQEILAPNRNTLRTVLLTGPGPHLFDPRASALNRLIASQLLRLRFFEHRPIGDHDRIEAADDTDPVFVDLQRQAGPPITEVVLRFGVDRSIDKIAGLPASVRSLQRAWDRIPARVDPTRVRLWTRFTPISEDIDHSALLFLSPAARDFLPSIVRRAIEDVNSPQVRNFRTVDVAQCFHSDEALFHAVRALCRAPVALFALGPDMGRTNLGGMLLMGIRAAVRRGATIVVNEGSLATTDWGILPFNLKELQIYGLERKPESAALLSGAIRQGLAVLHSDAQGYRDMPVFEIVRRPTRRTEKPAANEREVFVLCSFAKSYDDSWLDLRLWLDGKSDARGGELRLKRVIDYSSPLLAAERLYELTRHAGTCLIDWTDWSPNVFFEMGVRLAVASTSPVCLLRYNEQAPDETARHLMQRFTPLHYESPGDESGESFRAEFLERLAALQPDAESVYSVAERNMAVQDEYGGRPLHEQLFAAAQTLLGPDLANLNMLYGRNVKLRRQMLQSAADALVAAGLLLDRQLDPDNSAPDHAPLRETRGQIDSLLAELQELLDELP